MSGLVVLVIYVEMQMYYGFGKRAFQSFLISGAEGFVKYWKLGMVMLKDSETGLVHSHDRTEERLRALEVDGP